MKKIFSLLLVFLMVCSLLTVNVSAYEPFTVDCESITISPGQLISVKIDIYDYDWEWIRFDVFDDSIVDCEWWEDEEDDDWMTEWLDIYGYKVGTTTIKITLRDEDYEVIGEKNISVNCVESTVKVDDTIIINYDEEVSKQVLIGFTGGIPDWYGISITNYNENVIDYILGGFQGNEEKVTFIAINEGRATVHIEFYDNYTEETFASKTISVVVHKHEVVIDAAVPANCVKTGLTEGKHCATCGKVIAAQQVVPASNHIVVFDNAKAATYVSTGLKNGSHCYTCGVVFIAQGVIPKLKLKTPTFKLTKGSSQFKVKYNKVTDATGFQIRYKSKGGWKTKTFNSRKSVTKVIKKLKTGNYKVQVRAFVKQGGITVYSNWSKTKTVKVK